MPLSTAEYSCYFCHLSFTPEPSVGGGYRPCIRCDGRIVDEIDDPWNETEVHPLGWVNPHGNLRHRRRRANGRADPAGAAAATFTATGSETRDMEGGREEMEEGAVALLGRHPSVNSRRIRLVSEDDSDRDDEIRPLPRRANGGADPADDPHPDRDDEIRAPPGRANGGADPPTAAATAAGSETMRGATMPRLTAEYRCPFCHLSFTPLPPRVGGGYLSCIHCGRAFDHELEEGRPFVNRRLDSLFEGHPDCNVSNILGLLGLLVAVVVGGITLYDFQKTPTKVVHYACYGLLTAVFLTLVLLIGGIWCRRPKVIWAGMVLVGIDVIILLAMCFMLLAEKWNG